MEPSVYKCTGISWDDYPMYSLVLTLEGDGGVCASFDCAGLGYLISHCAAADVRGPNNLVGKLFQLWWEGSGGLGGQLHAIRLHPAYRDHNDPHAGEWLKTSICLTDSKNREEIRGYLVIQGA